MQNYIKKNASAVCPQCALLAVYKLRQMEIMLGNLPKVADWKSHHIDDLLLRNSQEDHMLFTEKATEDVFMKICQK